MDPFGLPLAAPLAPLAPAREEPCRCHARSIPMFEGVVTLASGLGALRHAGADLLDAGPVARVLRRAACLLREAPTLRAAGEGGDSVQERGRHAEQHVPG